MKAVRWIPTMVLSACATGVVETTTKDAEPDATGSVTTEDTDVEPGGSDSADLVAPSHQMTSGEPVATVSLVEEITLDRLAHTSTPSVVCGCACRQPQHFW